MKTLLVILGPTGVGKTALALSVAESLKTPIVNADSRQIFRELPIGTAAPTEEEQRRVKHFFVGTKSIREDYNAGIYEREALAVISQLHASHDTVLLTGGSMMYIDAVCEGLDQLPTISRQVREDIARAYAEGGLEWLQQEVERIDPAYFAQVDKQNPQRLIHAIEISREAGVPYSALRQGTKAERDFCIIKVGLYRDRDQLYERINSRVEEMMRLGLEQEALNVYPMRGLNSLNTVGYKEMFQYFDGEISREQAISLIQQHSRNYAKRQMTWWNTPGRKPAHKQKIGANVVNTTDTSSRSDIVWFDAAKVKTDDIINLLHI